MGLFRKKKQEKVEEAVKKDDALRDEISKAYDEIMANGVNDEEKEEVNTEQLKKPQADLQTEIFKAKINAFKEKQTQETLMDMLKMLPGRRFVLPAVSNMKEPFEKDGDKMVLKKGAVLNPALLTSKDNKVFLPIFTDEQSMTQKSPSGIMMRLVFEQCVGILFNKKNPVVAITINPFSENLILGEDLLRQIFKEQPKKTEENK